MLNGHADIQEAFFKDNFIYSHKLTITHRSKIS